MIYLFLLPTTVYSFLFFDPILRNISNSMDPAGVILFQSEDPPSLWEIVKNETVIEMNSTISNGFDVASGRLALNTIGTVKRDRREGNENLFEEWTNLLKVLNISDSNDSASSNISKKESEFPSNEIFPRHWTLDRLL